MSIQLLAAADYEWLPSDPLMKFLALEEICRARMLAAITQDTPGDYDSNVRISYITIIAAAAEELGVEGIPFHTAGANVYEETQEVIQRVDGLAVRIRLRSASARDRLSVRLANRTKGIIENEVARLRTAVSESQLEDAKKRRLLTKIEDFRTELHKERLGYANALATLAIVAAGLAGSTSFLADAPDAVTTIIQLIGQDKEKEDAEVLRLEGPKETPLITDDYHRNAEKTSRITPADEVPF